MIFLSYNHNDKALVDHIANRIAAIVDKSAIFYDGWSIQPGDGIIAKMNDGLASCKFFFFFVTANSLQSKMVTLEWQNALMKSVAGGCRFIPIKADNSAMPAILLQNLYIDLANNGVDAAVAQIADVITGQSTYKAQPGFSNLQATHRSDQRKRIVKVEAKYFLEPIARFLVFVNNQENEISVGIKGESIIQQGFHPQVELSTGEKRNAISVAALRGLTPAHPIEIVLTPSGPAEINFSGLVMHQHSQDQHRAIPSFPA